MLDDIQLKTNRGLDVGTDSFINKLEKLLNRSLKCAKQGRPAKNMSKVAPLKKRVIVLNGKQFRARFGLTENQLAKTFSLGNRA